MTWGVSVCGTGPRQAARAAVAMLFALAAALVPNLASAKEVATATGHSRAIVVAPLTLIKVDDLDFGRIAVGNAAGTVSIDPTSGACTVTGPIIETGGCRRARFSGMGTKNMNARISLSQITNLTGPGQTMVLDNVILGSNATIDITGNTNSNGIGVGLTTGNGNSKRYSISTATGIYDLYVGGRLNVNANQLPGIYTGSITVSVQYQ